MVNRLRYRILTMAPRVWHSKTVQAQQVQLFLCLPPFEQQRVRLRAGGAGGGVGDAVAAKMAEVPAQFAPGGEQARVFKVAEGDGPDGCKAALLFALFGENSCTIHQRRDALLFAPMQIFMRQICRV